jgi:hypothetical protein
MTADDQNAGLQSGPLPDPDVLLIDPGKGDFFMIRLTAGGRFGGDSWHPSVADAQRQAKLEFGDALGDWERVPPDTIDAHAYAVEFLRRHLNGLR